MWLRLGVQEGLHDLLEFGCLCWITVFNAHKALPMAMNEQQLIDLYAKIMEEIKVRLHCKRCFAPTFLAAG